MSQIVVHGFCGSGFPSSPFGLRRAGRVQSSGLFNFGFGIVDRGFRDQSAWGRANSVMEKGKSGSWTRGRSAARRTMPRLAMRNSE